MGMKKFVLGAGLMGFVLIVSGIALVHLPAAMVVAGALLLVLAWLALDALGAKQ